MQYVETQMINNSPYHILFWKRYVDDIICSIETSNIQIFLSYLNSHNCNIQYVVEEEQNKTLNYLDIKIIRNLNNTLSFGIYRKNTHTGKYLNFKSNNPVAHKRSVAYSLFNRSKLICEDTKEKEIEDKYIREQLENNNYPRSLINKCYRKINNPSGAADSRDENVKFVKVPYIRGATERIDRMLKPYKIKLAMKPTNTLGM